MPSTLIPYRRNAARLPRIQNRDSTKTRSYVRIDLLLRTVSAVGLLLLGIAGWLLQARTENARRDLESRDREARAFLPAFRALAELELTLDDLASALATRSAADRATSPFVGRLKAAALAAYVGGEDPPSACQMPNLLDPFAARLKVKVGVRSAALMLADLLEHLQSNQTHLTPGCHADELRFSPPELGFEDPTIQTETVCNDKTRISSSITSAEAVSAWRAWNGDQKVSLIVVTESAPTIVRALHQQVIDATAKLVLRHPELGEQAVTIRSEVISQHRAPSLASQ